VVQVQNIAPRYRRLCMLHSTDIYRPRSDYNDLSTKKILNSPNNKSKF